MTTTIIIALCVLVLIAYIFDITSSKTKIPSVILLLISGWGVRQVSNLINLDVPDFSPILPYLGTFGLILIVLEGSLELELNKSKLKVIRKSLLGAMLPMIGLSFLIAFVFQYYSHSSLKTALINAIPFCVISSAIAIPSASNLTRKDKEYVIYESSLSDIIGVLLFNFLALNSDINGEAFGYFGLQLLIVIIASIIATLGLSLMLNKIDHHVKFIPIIIIIILIYAASKHYHLPGLLFIMIFGLSINNIDELKKVKWFKQFNPENLQKEVNKFRELTVEAAFLIRVLFFLVFGFLIETKEVLNLETLKWAIGIVVAILAIRFLQLKFSKIPLKPLLFVAPRGLITILLFLSVPTLHSIHWVNKSLVIQVILISAIVMMLGLIFDKSKWKEKLALQNSEGQPTEENFQGEERIDSQE